MIFFTKFMLGHSVMPSIRQIRFTTCFHFKIFFFMLFFLVFCFWFLQIYLSRFLKLTSSYYLFLLLSCFIIFGCLVLGFSLSFTHPTPGGKKRYFQLNSPERYLWSFRSLSRFLLHEAKRKDTFSSTAQKDIFISQSFPSSNSPERKALMGLDLTPFLPEGYIASDTQARNFERAKRGLELNEFKAEIIKLFFRKKKNEF